MLKRFDRDSLITFHRNITTKMRLCTPYCFDDSMQRFPYVDVTERYPSDVRCVKWGVLMNIDVEIHSWNLAGADFVPVNQIFRAKVKGSLAAQEGFYQV
jgi:hypothetical protein